MVVHNSPLLAIKAIDKGEAGAELLLWLMQLEAVVARIGGFIASQQDVAAGHRPCGLALQKSGEIIGYPFRIGPVGC